MKTYTYYDSIGGRQQNFPTLWEMVKFIETFSPLENSEGMLYCNETPLFMYRNINAEITFLSITE